MIFCHEAHKGAGLPGPLFSLLSLTVKSVFSNIFRTVGQPVLMAFHAEKDVAGVSLVKYLPGAYIGAGTPDTPDTPPIDIDAVVRRERIRPIGDEPEASIEGRDTQVRVNRSEVSDPIANYDYILIQDKPGGALIPHIISDIIAVSDIDYILEIK